IKAIKLLPETYTTSDLANTWVRVTGWGGMYPLAASELLLQTDMQIRDRGCSQNPAVFNPRSHLCLVGVNRSDICDGDSGAPLTIYLRGKVYLVGVISSGSVDCSGNRPAVAVFAGYHRAWIERTISE
ncbi:Serine proteases trypsin domain, partial [Trinorchestia longiramus]